MKSQIINHKSQILLLLMIAATIVSCRPKGIMHSWELRSLLVDLHKTDALLQISGLSGPIHKEERNYYYAQVLEQHGVTQAQFDSTLVWYTAHPALFDKIYPKVMAQLEKEEKSYGPIIPTKEEPTIISTPAPFTQAQLDSV